jgi:hypothetical protein
MHACGMNISIDFPVCLCDTHTQTRAMSDEHESASLLYTRATTLMTDLTSQSLPHDERMVWTVHVWVLGWCWCVSQVVKQARIRECIGVFERCWTAVRQAGVLSANESYHEHSHTALRCVCLST